MPTTSATAATGAQPASAASEAPAASVAPKRAYPEYYLKGRGTPWMVPFDPDPESPLYQGVRKLVRTHNKMGVRTRFFVRQSATDAVGKQLRTTASALYGFHVRRFREGKKYTTVARGPTTDHVLVFYSREPDLGPSHEWFKHLRFYVPQLRNLTWKDQPLFNVYKVTKAQHYKHLDNESIPLDHHWNVPAPSVDEREATGYLEVQERVLIRTVPRAHPEWIAKVQGLTPAARKELADKHPELPQIEWVREFTPSGFVVGTKTFGKDAREAAIAYAEEERSKRAAAAAAAPAVPAPARAPTQTAASASSVASGKRKLTRGEVDLRYEAEDHKKRELRVCRADVKQCAGMLAHAEDAVSKLQRKVDKTMALIANKRAEVDSLATQGVGDKATKDKVSRLRREAYKLEHSLNGTAAEVAAEAAEVGEDDEGKSGIGKVRLLENAAAHAAKCRKLRDECQKALDDVESRPAKVLYEEHKERERKNADEFVREAKKKRAEAEAASSSSASGEGRVECQQ